MKPPNEWPEAPIASGVIAPWKQFPASPLKARNWSIRKEMSSGRLRADVRVDDAARVDEGVAVVVGRGDDVAVAGEMGGEEERLEADAAVAVREEHERERARRDRDVAVRRRRDDRNVEHGDHVARHAGDRRAGGRIVDLGQHRTRAVALHVHARRVGRAPGWSRRSDTDRTRRRAEVVRRIRRGRRSGARASPRRRAAPSSGPRPSAS